ncbi:MAG: formylmethanofuran dehydrogenase [Chloroflexi bacterium]|nr:formylmethanofuran dehydrogenase [Chloroflexota bacterium]
MPYLDQLARLHPRLCPRQVLGVRMGQRAAELLQVAVPRRDKRLLAIVETDGCFADGVSVVTGCWFGRRTLRLEDYGRVATTVVDTVHGRGVRLHPHPRARDTALAWAPWAEDRWHAQLSGYQIMPAEQLLVAEAVRLEQPLERVLGTPGVRATCGGCGEEILNGRELTDARTVLCRACSLTPYYVNID